jgi:ankyrin repeat protein
MSETEGQEKELEQSDLDEAILYLARTGLSASSTLNFGSNLETILSVLIERGANVNKKDENGEIPLIVALTTGKSQTAIDLFLKFGANPKALDRHGNNVLMIHAGRSIDDKEIKTWLSLGLDINAQDKSGKTALLLAAARRNYRLVKDLLGNGADVNIADNEGVTPLMCLLGSNVSPEPNIFPTLLLFLDKGVDLNAQCKYKKQTALMKLLYVFDRKPAFGLKTLDLLLQKNPDLELKDYEGKSALLYVLKMNNSDERKIKIIDVLLNKGAKIDDKNAKGEGLLTVAILSACGDGEEVAAKKLVSLLLEKGAKDKDKQAWNWAMTYGFMEIVNLLEKKE